LINTKEKEPMNDNTGRDNSNSGGDQSQGNAGETSGPSFLEGIGNAISGIFSSVTNASKPNSDDADVASEVITQAPSAPVASQEKSTDSGEYAGPPAPVVLGSTDLSDTAETSMSADAGSSATATQEEEPFVGSGGVGSAEFYENLRKGHEAADDEYSSDLQDPNRQ
jgi:hypothetical protein